MEADHGDSKRHRAGPHDNLHAISPPRPHFSPRGPHEAVPRSYYPHPKDPRPPTRHENGHPVAADRRDAYEYPHEQQHISPQSAPVAPGAPYSQDPNYPRNAHPPPAPTPLPHPGSGPPPAAAAAAAAIVVAPEHQRTFSQSVKHEERHTSMDAPYGSHHYYGPPQHPQDPQRPPGIVTHGLPPDHQAGNAYTPTPYSAPPYMQTPGPADPMQAYNGQAGAQGARGQRPKAVRAQQACDNCRQRKARCDEGRPECSNCHDTGQQCTYRDVPIPKQDRTMNELIRKLDSVSETVERLSDYVMHRSSPTYPYQGRTEEQSIQASGQPSRPSQSPSFNQGFQPQFSREVENDVHNVPQSQESTMWQDGNASGRAQPAMEEDGKADEDDFNEELSIPSEHTTSAHKLLAYWDSIRQFFHKITDNTDYVMEAEENRGLLRLYGRGEGHDQDERPSARLPPRREPVVLPGSPGPGKYAGFDDHASIGASPDGSWGIAFNNTPPTDGIIPRNSSNIGGLAADGGLLLTEDVVRTLYASYLENIHIIQPFLDKRRTDQMIEKFIKRYSPRPYPLSPMFAVPNHVSGNAARPDTHRKQPKRKRSDEAMNDAAPTNGEPAHTPSVWPERSITNVIILLILALGKISLHKDPLPGWRTLQDQPNSSNSPRSTITDSPPHAVRSPLAATTPRSSSVPTTDMDRAAFASSLESRRSSNGTVPSFERRDTRPKNVDIVPGLAYYSYAASILGELFGGNTLQHLHANILAGLYNAQLIRVLDSWKYINQACIICQVLIKQARRRGADLTTPLSERPNASIGPTTHFVDQLLLGFWTCSQLEGDILAELEHLPHSGMSRLEDQLILPPYKAFESDLPQEEQNLIGHYYLSQIHLRKILNRMHQALYNTAYNNKRKRGWSKLRAEDLIESLAEWRSTLPPELRWDDTEPPSRNINAARMRGKYYGACYAVHRPFLRVVLEGAKGSKDLDPTRFSKYRPSRLPENGLGQPTDLKPGPLDETQRMNRYFLTKAEACVTAACHSTEAFDGVLFDENRSLKRMIVTNLFGTVSAQFGNVLVLAAALVQPQSIYLSANVNFSHLINRTLVLLRSLAPLSPTFEIEVKVLEQTHRILAAKRADSDQPQLLPQITPTSAASSFSHAG